MEKMAGGKSSRAKKWPKNKKELYLQHCLFLFCLFCIKYPAEHALKLKGVQGVEPPSRGLGTDGPDGGGGGGAASRLIDTRCFKKH